MITQPGELPFVFSVPCARAVAFLVWSCTMCASGSRTMEKRYLSSWVSPAWASAKLSVSWWRKRPWVRTLMPNSVLQQAVAVSYTENVELLPKRSRSQGCWLLAVLKRISFSSGRGVRSPKRNTSLKSNTGCIGDTLRCRPSAPCETCCPWNCFHTVVKPWALTAELHSWAVENVSQVNLSTDETEPVWCASLKQLLVLQGA